MKRIFVVFGIIVLSAVGVAAGTAKADGKFSTGNSDGKATIAAGQTLDSSWYAAGSQIALKGTVNGDVYCAGQYVTISGQVNGDILCAAQQITISQGAVIDGDVRLAGQNVTLEGDSKIAGTLSVFAQDVTIREGAIVGRDVNGGSQFLTVDGTIGRDLTFGLSQFTLGGTVKRNADVAVEKLDFEGSAKIGGNLNYTNKTELNIPAGVVGESTTWHEAKADDTSKDMGARSRAIVALSVVAFVVVMTLLFPRFLSGTAEANRQKPGKVLLAGMVAFGALVIMPIVGIVLLVSIVGILLVPVVAIAWVALLMVMLPLFSYYVGRLLVGDQIKNVILVSLFGAVVTLIALNVPFIGPIVGLAILLVGGGLAVLWLQETYRAPSYKPVEVSKKIVKK